MLESGCNSIVVHNEVLEIFFGLFGLQPLFFLLFFLPLDLVWVEDLLFLVQLGKVFVSRIARDQLKCVVPSWWEESKSFVFNFYFKLNFFISPCFTISSCVLITNFQVQKCKLYILKKLILSSDNKFMAISLWGSRLWFGKRKYKNFNLNLKYLFTMWRCLEHSFLWEVPWKPPWPLACPWRRPEFEERP